MNYKKGKVEMWFGDTAPVDINMLWLRPITVNGSNELTIQALNGYSGAWENIYADQQYINTTDITNVPEYISDELARNEGLVGGDTYRTGNDLKVVGYIHPQYVSSIITELSIDVNDFFEYGETVSVFPADSDNKLVTYLSNNTDVASVNSFGVITGVSDYSVDGPMVCTVTVYTVDGNHSWSTSVVNKSDLVAIKLNHSSITDVSFAFSAAGWLQKPDETVAPLTTEVAESCGEGECFFILPDNSVSMEILSGDFDGDLSSLYDGTVGITGTDIENVYLPYATEFSGTDMLSLTGLYIIRATSCILDGCTAITAVTANAATLVNCSGCTAVANINAANASTIVADGCALGAQAIEWLIGDALALATVVGNEITNGVITLTNGTNELRENWTVQAETDAAALELLGWTITFNTEIIP